MNELCARIITGAFLALSLSLSFFYIPILFSCMVLIALCAILLFELPRLYASNRWWWFLTPLYPVMPFLIMLWLNHTPYRLLLIMTFFLVAVADTAAYCAGTLWGKHKIAPRISPGKSWEGFFGAWLCCFLVLLAIRYLLCASSHIGYAIIFSGALVTLGTMGDFFESYLKRQAGLKDSGTLLPGHGGLLDRFDAILFVIIFVALSKNYILSFLCL